MYYNSCCECVVYYIYIMPSFPVNPSIFDRIQEYLDQNQDDLLNIYLYQLLRNEGTLNMTINESTNTVLVNLNKIPDNIILRICEVYDNHVKGNKRRMEIQNVIVDGAKSPVPSSARL